MKFWVLLGVLLPAVASAQTQAYCSAPGGVAHYPPGATRAVGQVAMVMTNSGQPCRHSFALGSQGWSHLEVRQQPANGTVTLAPPIVAYLPRPGYLGPDQFVVATPSANWTVRVSVVPAR